MKSPRRMSLIRNSLRKRIRLKKKSRKSQNRRVIRRGRISLLKKALLIKNLCLTNLKLKRLQETLTQRMLICLNRHLKSSIKRRLSLSLKLKLFLRSDRQRPSPQRGPRSRRTE